MGVSLSTIPIQTTNVHNAVAIASGDNHCLAIEAEGVIQGRVSFDNLAFRNVPVQFEFRPVSSGDRIIRTETLSTFGVFSFHNIPEGIYDIAITAPRFLRTVIHNVSTVGGANVNNLFVTLLVGDANNDNSVDVFDLDIFIRSFDAVPGDSNWSPYADFNNDNNIDVLDLDLLIRNFDKIGDE